MALSQKKAVKVLTKGTVMAEKIRTKTNHIVKREREHLMKMADSIFRQGYGKEPRSNGTLGK